MPPETQDRLLSVALPAGENFLDTLAATFFARYVAETQAGDLSALLVLVPALPIAAELRAALVRAAPRALLLPRFATLAQWVEALPLAATDSVLPTSERRVLLHEALRARGWFDESALWAMASELADLFDELTAAAVILPDDEASLLGQLQAAYAMRASAPLVFEARVVHELWHALTAPGQTDAASLYRLKLAALARQAEDWSTPRQDLLVLLDAAPAEALDSAERHFLQRYAQAQRLFVFHPEPSEKGSSPLARTLAAAWPIANASDLPGLPPAQSTALFERARALQQDYPQSPLLGRLQLVPTEGREQEAQAVVAQIGQWLLMGKRRIALIAQDRLTARRVRALLEREYILVNDETGWKLSTSRAAATLDALIETAASGAYYRDVLDLCKSPFVFADLPEETRQAVVFRLESTIRSASVKLGLSRIRRCFLETRWPAETAGQSDFIRDAGKEVLNRIETTITLLCAPPTSLARWIERLLKALECLGAHAALQGDMAGKVVLDVLETRRRELAGNVTPFSLAAWRDWLGREFESAHFRDGDVNSPIVLTPLNAVCLRRFEAAVLIGGDARQLAPLAHGAFFNTAVRRELGLKTHVDSERELYRDLELLLSTVPCVSVTWQSVQNGEANQLAPSLARLSSLHQLAWRDDLFRPPQASRREAQPPAQSIASRTTCAVPIAPVALIPRRVSVSAYASLVACPYQFFARYVLGLGEMDEVSEEMQKSDYGALVHRVLERFHTSHPCLQGVSDSDALAALQACVDAVFAPLIEANFLSIAWRMRWEKRLSAYLAWQRAQETAGWRWSEAEVSIRRRVPLPNDEGLELHGRMDRMDRNGDAIALLDYKTQSAKVIRDRLPNDVQLPTYAFMYGDVAQAAYVALDDERVVSVSAGDDEANNALSEAAAAQGERLNTVFTALYAGAPLPAHGVPNVCQWCEMSGLCRRDYV